MVLPCLGFAQTPAFDAADVRISEPGTKWSREFLPGGRLDLRGATLVNLIMLAYGVEDEVITGGPPWLGTDLFDVRAKAPRGSSDETMKLMLRALLADRFKLAIHTVDKPMPVFALLPGKRLLLKESDSADESACRMGNDHGQLVVTCRNLTMAALAERIRPWAPRNALNHPVVDLTGLTRGYDFSLRLGGSVSIFDAVETQLGLKLEERKHPMPVFAIDSVNRAPTLNPPGTEEKFPADPTEFEVADIRPSKPGAELEGSVQPGGRVDFRGISILDLIQLAYGDLPADRIAGPKWMESERFAVLAKPPSSVSGRVVEKLMRSLLADRFKLVFHYEDQPIPVYALVVGKKGSKMEPTSGTERAGCTVSNANDKRTYACKNVTMTQFAEKLRLGRPVVDATGLTGTYSFILTWTPQGDVSEQDAEYPGGLTVFAAIERQLGLRLENEKRPLPVMVIDHLNRTPTDN